MTARKPEHTKHLDAIAGAVMGLDVIAVLQMLSLPNLDRPLTISIYLFAVAIPLLSAFLVNMQLQYRGATVYEAWYNELLFTGGLAISLGAILAIFFHFSTNAFYAFMVAGMVGLVAVQAFTMKAKAKPRG